jgi:hypothetical protein
MHAACNILGVIISFLEEHTMSKLLCFLGMYEFT